MGSLKRLHDFFFFCGIGKEEYAAIKKDAYISNFVIWRILHFLMAITFLALFSISLINDLLKENSFTYLIAFLYSACAIACFFSLKKDSLIAQFLIYLSISLLLLLGALITLKNPAVPATTFIIFLVITPMFMIDRPIFMTLELCTASSIFLLWMHSVKSYDIWIVDVVNVCTFTVVGVFLNVIANAVRIREFVLTRKINIQKDTDEMTGLKNKGALTREINEFLQDSSTDKGMMFMLDIDRFKMINDTYGHDVGDSVISQLGRFLGGKFTGSEIVGRFGGDEFIVFIQNTDEKAAALKIADEIVKGASENVSLPVAGEKISTSIGIAIYTGTEKNYSELFKKADLALYKSKADSVNRFYVYE